ncbi:single hybrid motif-containing protein [Guyanagaster necrorhizus]|uniref:Single hybrid motif-containing protein n=1 Tax=Guyanagaster necrorhizus TaxID=856835 RepID=A0A9P7W5M0_9AGAR|nr:single hybrid motif-containing protein [Guyanagaster necrorhizus MCA 3950]KAG7453024.1 single hybrid motif-containing protein [Guyanagaster necrorhizus MCA 3950]
MRGGRQFHSASRTLYRCSQQSRRLIHSTPSRHEISTLQMPAMSPTMTEGGIASWKKQPGEAFIAGDVLLEIETDKATIDVEAVTDGLMAKILLPDGTKNIPIGKVIAMLAEEGDDISNVQAPKEAEASPTSSLPKQEAAPSTPHPAPTPVAHSSSPPTHPRTLFPSVYRLLQENNITNAEQIKGTGVRGMLTKGDVLAFLGKASGPLGTYKESTPTQSPMPIPKKDEPKPIDAAALRQLIVSTMLRNSVNPFTAPGPPPDFDSVIGDYLSSPPAAPKPETKSPAASSKSTAAYFDGLI